MQRKDEIRHRKPRSAGLRFQSFLKSGVIDEKYTPEKSLLSGNIKHTGGRNCYGRITVRHRGGGASHKYRIIDFKRQERNCEGVIKSIQYDPNRNLPIALVFYSNGSKSYIILPENLLVGDKIRAGINVEAKVGNCLPLRNIPIGFTIHNIELKPGQGGKLVRSAGNSAQLMSKENEYALIKMPSGEIRMINLECWATVGSLSHGGYKNIVIGKAGNNRHRGIRPSVRGVAMNPVDHPRGGGEGKSKSGSFPISPWGKCSHGTKTRKKRNRFIVQYPNDLRGKK